MARERRNERKMELDEKKQKERLSTSTHSSGSKTIPTVSSAQQSGSGSEMPGSKRLRSEESERPSEESSSRSLIGRDRGSETGQKEGGASGHTVQRPPPPITQPGFGRYQDSMGYMHNIQGGGYGYGQQTGGGYLNQSVPARFVTPFMPPPVMQGRGSNWRQQRPSGPIRGASASRGKDIKNKYQQLGNINKMEFVEFQEPGRASKPQSRESSLSQESISGESEELTLPFAKSTGGGVA